MAVSLQTRDYEILRRLSFSYRITTAFIEASNLDDPVSKTTMRKRLMRLAQDRWLCPLTAWCVDLGVVHEPLFHWSPGDVEPDFGAVSYKARRRWDDRPIRKTTVYTASRKALALWGLPQRKHLKLHHASHDIGCNQMFWYARKTWPHLEFVSEDLFAPRGHGEGVEDAHLCDGDRITCVLEHAGAYRADRVQHLHEHVALERNLPYYLF